MVSSVTAGIASCMVSITEADTNQATSESAGSASCTVAGTANGTVNSTAICPTGIDAGVVGVKGVCTVVTSGRPTNEEAGGIAFQSTTADGSARACRSAMAHLLLCPLGDGCNSDADAVDRPTDASEGIG